MTSQSTVEPLHRRLTTFRLLEAVAHLTTAAAFVITILLVTTGVAEEANLVTATLLSSVGWTATGLLALVTMTVTFAFLERQRSAAPRAVVGGAVLLALLGFADLAVNLWILGRVGLPETVLWSAYAEPVGVMAGGGLLAAGRHHVGRVVSSASVRRHAPSSQTVGAVVFAVLLMGSIIGPFAALGGLAPTDHDGVASAATWTQNGTYTGHSDTVSGLDVGPDGYLYSASYDNGVHKIDPSDMSVVGTYTGHTNAIESLKVGPGGFVYSGGYGNTVHKINTSDMSQEAVYNGHSNSVEDVAIGPEGYLYSASYAGEFHKIDPSDMSQVGVYDGNTYSGFGRICVLWR
jgi:hypothetical protein